jgi:hypothetical protein
MEMGVGQKMRGKKKTLRLTIPVGVVDLKLCKNLGVNPQNHTQKLPVRILEILQPDWDVAAIPKALAWRGKIHHGAGFSKTRLSAGRFLVKASNRRFKSVHWTQPW